MSLYYHEIFGRDALVAEVVKHLMDGTSVVLHGDEGVGKSAILMEVLQRLSDESCGTVLHVSSIRNEKPLWQELCFQLDCDVGKKRISGSGGMNTAELAQLVIRAVMHSRDRIFLLVDFGAAGSLPTKTSEGLSALLSRGVIFLVATRSLTANKDFMGKIESQMEVGGLDREAAYAYIDHLTEGWVVEDPEHVRKSLFAKTDGRPGLIEKALRKHEESMRLTNAAADQIRDLVVRKIRYMYMPISILFIALLMFNRYLARVTSGGRVGYLLGAAGLVVVLIFRLTIYSFLKRTK